MINTNYFNIYNASAGTGKTFSLVRDYLILLFNSNNFELYKSILAITFTNKAVNEMKGRIIRYLINYSNSIDPDEVMIKEIAKVSGLTKKEIFTKSSIILKNLLKNYGSFEILTIDKLTQKIVRNFTYELGIDAKYEIELDQNEVINQAVDNLISKIELNDERSKNIINFSSEKTQNDKSWDITKDLKDIAELIFDENNFSELDYLKDSEVNDFERWKKNLRRKIKKTNSETKIIARNAIKIIDEREISHDSFLFKSVPKHFIKISHGELDNLYNNQIEKNLTEGNLYPKRITEKDKINIEKIRINLLDIYKSCKTNIFKIKLYENILNNLSPLSILSEIKKEIELLKKEGNFILISEFNKLINEEIKNQPAPFIYEKIGTKFSHFFIDEFQDTSKMQWENLKPLIENSLSSDNSSLTLAGDPKQSIYRWRGGDVDEFMNLLINESPFYCEKTTIDLNTNFRSAKEIISFNNSLFKHISTLFADNFKLAEILNFPDQNSFKKERGYINLKFHDKNDEIKSDKFYNTQILSNVRDLVSRGYLYKDICIIVRKKKEGILVGDYLTENNIPIISSEVLRLSSSPQVSLIINLIRYHVDSSDFNKIKFCESLCELNFIDQIKEDFLIETFDKDFSDIKKQVIIDKFNFDFNRLNRTSIYEAIEYIIDEFGIMNDGNSYVQFFLDFALDYSNKYQTGLNEFIEQFEEKKEKLNIINPQGINAVEIITIHKSKGLEFPVVIYPYANINIHGDLNPKTWIDIKNDDNFGLQKSIININKDLEKIDGDLYSSYRNKLEVDNINLLYVVLTRAIKELHIISEKNLDSKGNENINYFSGIFISYLKNIGVWEDSKMSYEFGDKVNVKSDSIISRNIIHKQFEVNSRIKQNILINSKNTDSWINELSEAQEEGNIFHQIMEEVNSKKEISIVLNRFYQSGSIGLSDMKNYEQKILQIVNHPGLKKYYNGDLVSYNEREIISKKGFVLVPDRLVFLNNTDVVIIDYKTGKENESHKIQLKKYKSMLEEMNFKVAEKILVYVNEKIKINKC
ncbi:MAG: DNA helicase UvrD [Flavobacteriaceae bacterium]|nr:DNA helicase UvrD [Flavobacteriaceae bacterium]|tara:strand:+ start:2472 stop:5585 length:3114 start_codon:yes stop_codon:yes gene_type:complete